MTVALAWISSMLVFLALDAVWLGLAGGSFYRAVLGDIMLSGFRPVPAALFYPLQITGIVVFVLPLARRYGSFLAAAGFGALFGLCTYGTYDLTNQAVLKVWTTQLTVIDMTWGAIVTAAASVTAAFVSHRRAGW